MKNSRRILTGLLIICLILGLGCIPGMRGAEAQASWLSWFLEDEEETPQKDQSQKENSWTGNSDTPSNQGSSGSAGSEVKPSGSDNKYDVDDSDSIFDNILVEEDEYYSSKEEVAVYIHEFGHLPDNYITKREAQDLGWDKSQNYVGEVAEGMSIGGDKYGNYEGTLPEKKGRKYYECDIDYSGKKRNAKRIIYSNDGLIFYTEDHYETFEQLWPEED